MKLKFSFEQPESGCMPCRLELVDEEIEFWASHILNNPVADLADCLWDVCRGDDAEVHFWMEPAGYYFSFHPKGDKTVFRVVYSRDSTVKNRELVHESQHDTLPLLKMFWRSARKVVSYDISAEYCFGVNEGEMCRLKERIEACANDI